jgi:hypothetical protein
MAATTYGRTVLFALCSMSRLHKPVTTGTARVALRVNAVSLTKVRVNSKNDLH